MPRISEFLGISTYVYWRDHPPPHFHVLYAEYHAVLTIGDLVIRDVALPPRVLALVVEWATRHHDQLRRVWEQAAGLEPLSTIEPLH